ncbi:MAG TPA: hypothetical protein VH592_13280 [Gemmataceae bacterium]|jgi:hypothetical protein
MKKWMVLTLMVVPVIYVVASSKGKEGEWRWSLDPIPQQQTISDEDGIRTATLGPDVAVIPLPAVAPGPVMPTPTKLTIASVRQTFNEVVDELLKALQEAERGNGSLTVGLSTELARRLKAVYERLGNPDCDLTHEWQEIHQVRALLLRTKGGVYLSPTPGVPLSPPVPKAEPIKPRPKKATDD